MQKAIAFALIRLGKISGRSKPGTGPAPKANVSTNTRVPPTDKHNAEKCGKYELVAPT